MHGMEQLRAPGGQARAARQAVEQGKAQLALQGADLVRHGRGRDRELGGGALETRQARHGLEDAQPGQRQAGKHGKTSTSMQRDEFISSMASKHHLATCGAANRLALSAQEP